MAPKIELLQCNQMIEYMIHSTPVSLPRTEQWSSNPASERGYYGLPTPIPVSVALVSGPGAYFSPSKPLTLCQSSLGFSSTYPHGRNDVSVDLPPQSIPVDQDGGIT